MDTKNYRCETCAISTPRLDVETGRMCRLFNIAVKDTDFCFKHTKSLFTCDCCGQPFIGNPYIVMSKIDDNTVSGIEACICPKCNQNINTCKTCAQMHQCAFETDPSPLPKVVQKQVQQGNMYAVTQVMNPDRIAITCQKDCPCWSSDFCCSKQNYGTCQQYHMNQV